MKFLAHQLACSFLNKDSIHFSIKDKFERAPILFPLRDFELKMESFIINQFHKNGVNDILFPQFLEKIKNKEIILILDGFDEMTSQMDAEEKRRNFDRIAQIAKNCPNGKIILTCREEYFHSEEDLQNIFRRKDKINYQFIHLMPFDDEQIKSYLSNKTDYPEFYWQQIQDLFELHDLAKRPVLLDLIIRYLPQLINEISTEKSLIKASDLYRRCIEDELDRKIEDLAFSFNIPGKYRVKILQLISLSMFHSNELSIDIRLEDNRSNLKQFFNTKTEWEFEKYLNEFLSFTFLIREADYIFRISHKSFRDYLVADALTEEIDSKFAPGFFQNQT